MDNETRYQDDEFDNYEDEKNIDDELNEISAEELDMDLYTNKENSSLQD